jgi:hypothetical protein
VEVTEELWNWILREASYPDGSINVMLACGGAVFPFKLRVNDRLFRQNVSFVGAILEDGCEIRNCEFRGGLGLNFVDFWNAPGYFEQCTIKQDLFVSYTRTDQHIAFVSCPIDGKVTAEGVACDFRLENCDISGPCDLSQGAVSHLSLANTVLRGELTATDLEAGWVRAPGLELVSGSVVGPMTVKTWVELSGARFTRRVQLVVDAATLTLAGAMFAEGGRLEVQRANIGLDRLILGAHLSIVGGNSAAVSSLRAADAGMLSLSTVDLSDCRFYGAHNLQALTLEPTVALRSPPPRLRTTRRCIADEFDCRAAGSGWRKKDWLLKETSDTAATRDTAPPPLTPAQVAGVYRALRRSVEAQSDEPGASDFYYGEMEMRRLDRSKGLPERSLVWLYWLIAGYGLRALRPLLGLFIVLFVGAKLMVEIGLKSQRPGLDDGAIAVAESLVPAVPVHAPLTTQGRWIDVMLSILGPVLLGLAALAVRNRVKR